MSKYAPKRSASYAPKRVNYASLGVDAKTAVMTQKRFNQRANEWLEKIQRLRVMQSRGFVYVRRFRAKVPVRKHTRAAHYAWIPVRAETAEKYRRVP